LKLHQDTPSNCRSRRDRDDRHGRHRRHL
jgi:hypothetical protein